MMSIRKMTILAVATLVTALWSAPVFSSGTNKHAEGGGGTAKNRALPDRLAGPVRPLNRNFLGGNMNDARGPSFHDQAFRSALTRLDPATLRYPAGTLANYWDWRTGWFVKSPKPPHGLGRIKPTVNRLGDFRLGLDAAHAEPLFDLNLMTATLSDQLAMLRRARSLGLPVRYVELGNEFYIPKKNYVARFPTPESYARTANTWAAAIKREFPGAKIAAVGSPFIPGKGRRKSWNREVMPLLHNVDAYTIHPYTRPGLVRLMRAQGWKGKIFRSGAPLALQKAEWAALESTYGVAIMLSMPGWEWQNVMKPFLAELPTGVRCWVTEYNMWPVSRVATGIWAHGLFLAEMTLSFLRSDRIELVDAHDVVSNAMFGLIYRDDRGLNGLIYARPTKALGLTAAGVAYRQLAKAMRGMTSARQIEFESNPMVKLPADTSLYPKDDHPYPALVGWAFHNTHAGSAIVLNLSSEEVGAHTLSIISVAGSSYEQVSASPFQVVTRSSDVTDKTGIMSKIIELPPYSITRFTFSSSG
jgi:hypothetical protein